VAPKVAGALPGIPFETKVARHPYIVVTT
jgi:hypothetical protein